VPVETNLKQAPLKKNYGLKSAQNAIRFILDVKSSPKLLDVSIASTKNTVSPKNNPCGWQSLRYGKHKKQARERWLACFFVDHFPKNSTDAIRVLRIIKFSPRDFYWFDLSIKI